MFPFEKRHTIPRCKIFDIWLLIGTSVPGGASSSVGAGNQGKKGYPVSVFVCSDPSAFTSATAAIKRFVKFSLFQCYRHKIKYEN